MREFNYSLIKDKKWDSELLGLVAAIYKEAGKQEMYLKQRPEKLERHCHYEYAHQTDRRGENNSKESG